MPKLQILKVNIELCYSYKILEHANNSFRKHIISHDLKKKGQGTEEILRTLGKALAFHRRTRI